MDEIDRRTMFLGLVGVGAFLPTGIGNAQPSRGARAQASKAVARSRANGGHLHRHVGQSRNGLAGQSAAKGMRLNFNAARLGLDARKGGKLGKRSHTGARVGFRKDAKKAGRKLVNYRLSKRQASTFKTGTHADKMYAHALRSNRAAVKKWLSQPLGKRPASFPLPFNAGAPVGTVYSARSGSYRAASKGAFYVKSVPGTSQLYPVSAKLY